MRFIHVYLFPGLGEGKKTKTTHSKDNSNNYKQYEISYEVAQTSMVHIIFFCMNGQSNKRFFYPLQVLRVSRHMCKHAYPQHYGKKANFKS